MFSYWEKQGRAPWSSDGEALLAFTALADSRAAPLIVATWKDAVPKAKKYEKNASVMGEWAAWRKSAAAALAVTGTKDDVAFLREQAAATVDKHVKAACEAAIAAIEKR